MCDAGRMWLICGGPTRCVQPEYTLEKNFVSQSKTLTLSSLGDKSLSFVVNVQNACMHGTNGNKYLEAGQTAGYDGYKLIGQSVHPPQAAKIHKTTPMQGDTFLHGHHYI